MITGEPLNVPDSEMLSLARYRLESEGVAVPEGWNPLENDDEAFRLGVTLHINLYFRGISLTAKAAHRLDDDWWAEVWYDSSREAATRRAIVAVAAIMGRFHRSRPVDWWRYPEYGGAAAGETAGQ